MQPKIDGERLLIESDGAGTVRCFNRYGDATIGPAAAVAELAAWPVPVVLDGERLGDQVLLFDLVSVVGREGAPLAERLAVLERFVEAMAPGHLRLVPTARTMLEKHAMMRHVVEQQGEGWVLKRTDSLYRPGERSLAWRKLKRWRDVDCVVAWVGDPTKDGEKDNMGLSMYDLDGDLVNVAECTRRAGHGQQVKPGDVVSVQCLYASDDDRLVQPSRPRIRTDKPARECTTEQLDDIRTSKTYVLDWDWKEAS